MGGGGAAARRGRANELAAEYKTAPRHEYETYVKRRETHCNLQSAAEKIYSRGGQLGGGYGKRGAKLRFTLGKINRNRI